MAASSLLSLTFLISTLLLLASSSLSVAPNPATITIPLSPIPFPPIFLKNQVPIKTLNSLASGYSISLNFGTPPQTISFLLDTGSSPVWFPCTSRYVCTDCHKDPFKIPLFIPERSSSSKFIDCQNPTCARISSSNSFDCQGCNCSRACSYSFLYGKGSTFGRLLSETLDFPEKLFTNFLVGCSNSSDKLTGVAGFGQTRESLPHQLGLSKFSYCLSSRRFNDTSESSDLVLYRGSSSDAKTPGLSYTPFSKDSVLDDSGLPMHYYVDLVKVIVGSKSVNIPDKYLVPDDNDNGGTIVDSGMTFTIMEKPILDDVVRAFGGEMGNFTRASADVEEALTGRGHCFDITGLKFEKIKFPELTFEFKDGAKMELPAVNYFEPFEVRNSSLACLTIIAKGALQHLQQLGPAIILGNIQQKNFYVEFDLKNKRFGFRKQTCNKK